MKITDIKTFVVDCFRTNWAFVKVYTDEGIDGVGEATLEYKEHALCGAVEHMFQRVTTDYAGAKIGFVIAHKQGAVGGEYYENRRYYFDTIKVLCEKWGIPYIDLWTGCYLNPTNPAHYIQGGGLFYTDGQHLTSAGYDYITPMIEAWMKTL